MKINWKVRFKNPLFIAQLGMSILVPILAYAGLTVQDLTTWKALGDLLLGVLPKVIYRFNAVPIKFQWHCSQK